MLDLQHLAVFAIVIYVMQGFAGYPLTSIVLKKEGKMLLEKYRKGELKVKNVGTQVAISEPRRT